MTNKQDIKNLYDLLVNTLSMLSPDFQKIEDNKLIEFLEELEGDYYTFLHKINTHKIMKEGYITEATAQKIEKLRNKIGNIMPNLWDIHSFKENQEWKLIHEKANEILSDLKVKTN